MLRQQLAETDKSIENMLNAIQQGIFTSSANGRLDALEKTKADLELAILKEEMERPTPLREFITSFFHRFRKLDIANNKDQTKAGR